MKEVGLLPSTPAKLKAGKAGQSVSHHIIHGGAYAKAYVTLEARGFQLHWQSPPAGQQAKAKEGEQNEIPMPIVDGTHGSTPAPLPR
jgi:hypothetical protein